MREGACPECGEPFVWAHNIDVPLSTTTAGAMPGRSRTRLTAYAMCGNDHCAKREGDQRWRKDPDCEAKEIRDTLGTQ